MRLVHNKSLKDLINNATIALSKAGILTKPGSIAKLFINVIMPDIEELYKTLNETFLQCMVSQANGFYLDEIGLLVNCKRLANEEDSLYRARITSQVQYLASCNELSIRLAALSVEGVDDVVIKKYALGGGSYSILIVTDNLNDIDIIKVNVANKIDEVSAFGIKYIVDTPKLKQISFDISLVTKDMDEIEKQNIISNTYLNIRKFIKGLKIGQGISREELTKVIMNTNDNISSYYSSIKINNIPVTTTNQGCEWNEKFILSLNKNPIKIK